VQKTGGGWETPGDMAGEYSCAVLLRSWNSANSKCWRWVAGPDAPFFEQSPSYVVFLPWQA